MGMAGRVTGVARDVGADRRGMGLRDALRSMTGGAGAPFLVVGGVASAAGSRRVYRCQGTIGRSRSVLRVPLVREGDGRSREGFPAASTASRISCLGILPGSYSVYST
jgi:hypothetical protein